MIIPIRCFTCNKVIANKWLSYKKNLSLGFSKDESLNKIGINRYCCRRMFLSQTDTFDMISRYSDKTMVKPKEIISNSEKLINFK